MCLIFYLSVPFKLYFVLYKLLIIWYAWRCLKPPISRPHFGGRSPWATEVGPTLDGAAEHSIFVLATSIPWVGKLNRDPVLGEVEMDKFAKIIGSHTSKELVGVIPEEHKMEKLEQLLWDSSTWFPQNPQEADGINYGKLPWIGWIYSLLQIVNAFPLKELDMNHFDTEDDWSFSGRSGRSVRSSVSGPAVAEAPQCSLGKGWMIWMMWETQYKVSKATIDQPYLGSLQHPFMVKLGMVDYCCTTLYYIILIWSYMIMVNLNLTMPNIYHKPNSYTSL